MRAGICQGSMTAACIRTNSDTISAMDIYPLQLPNLLMGHVMPPNDLIEAAQPGVFVGSSLE
jgi:hypothetical protein